MRNVDNGQSASGQAQQAMQDASHWTSYYEDRAAAGGGGVPVVEAASANTPVALPDDPVVTGTHRAGCVMDLLDALRGDIPELSPLERFARLSAVGDVLEDRQAEVRRAERADEREGMLMAEAAAERQQLATRGWTDRELAER
jgi:hypothetical protein